MSATRLSQTPRPRAARSEAPSLSTESTPKEAAPIAMEREVPSTLRFIWADWWALVGLALAVAPWSVPLLLGLIGRLPAVFTVFSGVSALCSLLGALLLYFRLRRLRRFFEQGVELSGIIESSYLFFERGRVFFSYHYKHGHFQSSMTLHDTWTVRTLRRGKTVRVLVDPNNPTRAILPAVFDTPVELPQKKVA